MKAGGTGDQVVEVHTLSDISSILTQQQQQAPWSGFHHTHHSHDSTTVTSHPTHDPSMHHRDFESDVEEINTLLEKRRQQKPVVVDLDSYLKTS